MFEKFTERRDCLSAAIVVVKQLSAEDLDYVCKGGEPSETMERLAQTYCVDSLLFEAIDECFPKGDGEFDENGVRVYNLEKHSKLLDAVYLIVEEMLKDAA